MRFSTIFTVSMIPGLSGVSTHEPTAMSALNVCDDMLCCNLMWLTSNWPREKVRSASTDEAMELHQLENMKLPRVHTPGAKQKSDLT